MPLEPLATVADLEERGIHEFPGAPKFLAVASAAVRTAAGSPISETTSTVTLDGYYGEPWIRLPGPPVIAVSTVTIDSVEVDDWRLATGRLWRRQGWANSPVPGRPSTVEVTYTHGLAVVPDDIVDLVCSMVAAAGLALEEAEDGTGLAVDNGRRQSVTIDGFTETFATSGDALEAITPMMLPARTRAWLADRFGTGVGNVVSR